MQSRAPATTTASARRMRRGVADDGARPTPDSTASVSLIWRGSQPAAWMVPAGALRAVERGPVWRATAISLAPCHGRIGSRRRQSDRVTLAALSNGLLDRKSTRLNSSHLGISY